LKDITIIGGSGFIGSVLINTIGTDYQIKNIDKNKSNIMDTAICDVRDIDKLEETLDETDAVILLAAEHKDNVSPTSLYYDVNVEGAKNVLNVMRKKNIQTIFFTSTVAVYGLNKENPDESHPVDPFNDYGKSKYQTEDLLRAWFNEDPENRNLVIVRPTVVFGVENRGNVYNLLQQILKGNFKMVGNGKNKKSMSYVENIAAFFKYLMDNNYKGYHLFNYVDKPDLSTKELITTISNSCERPLDSFSIPYPVGYLAGIAFDVLAKITGKEQQISSVRIKKFCSTTQFSNKRIQEETNFTAPYSLEDGLDKTIKSLL
jgi:nucleoside-diphosphate-sugar epimerase